ncbi:MAG TPA: GNAT family N-acetyltransferase [Acidimicrobiales bacterium]
MFALSRRKFASPSGGGAGGFGVHVRQATTSDLEQIVDLQVDRNGPECEPMIRALVASPENGIGCFTVAVDGARVVSSLCLMREAFVLEGVRIPVGRPEFVATHRDFEHQGLVRDQMDLVHGWSADRGDLVQVITGIPYFYRRFGYEYAIPMPRVRIVNPGVTVGTPDGWSVRHAALDDVDAIVATSSRALADVPLVAVRSPEWWRWWVSNDTGGGWYLAVRDGRVRGCAFVGDGPPGIDNHALCVAAIAAHEEDAVWALVADAFARAGGKPVAVEERTGLARVAAGISSRHSRQYAVYVRVADPVALLDHLRPVLTARLRRSHHASSSGTLLLSTYASSLTIHYANGEISAIERGGPHKDPVGSGGIGVPPDLVATLLFGRYGATELAERHPDVRLGRRVDLAEILFPRVEADLVMSL